MVSDQEIASCVESLLRQSGPGGPVTSVNVNSVVQQLEAKLGFDLSHKAGFIRDQINLLLRPALPAPFKDNRIAVNQQQQQQHIQQQFIGGQPHQLLQHHQFPPSPFTHLSPQDELTFRSAPSAAMQSHQLLQQQPAQVQAQSHPATGVRRLRSKNSSTGSKRKGGSGGLSKLCGVSPQLQAIVGEPALPRTQIVKELWAYIRKNNLQDPNNKRKIICNDELRLVFETDCTDMFQMNKLLAKHILPLEPSKEPSKKKQKATEAAPATETDAGQTLVMVSDELAKFFGSGEREMLQSEALKRVWDYIDTYQLKDPLNPKMVRCDAKLQQLFGCESLSALGVSEMLASHLFKQS
ncbi:unnamed protein product [Spirodela intermedia]|uniref:Uncharacterized protein n=1 Tax=Spirodela intermedia TaxID=51605 RepID=A0A7I8JQE5_SPIIN|nr:unnamed protein product [Spirodela intermedia]CAA6672356.1 unnamed protein product [Spirodela intermedia]